MYSRKTVLLFFMILLSTRIFSQIDEALLMGEIFDKADNQLIKNCRLNVQNTNDSLRGENSGGEYLLVEGNFSLQLKKGTYFITVRAEGYQSYEEKFELLNDITLKIEMERLIIYENLLGGIVINESSEPITNANLYLYEENTKYSAWSSSDREGKFSFRNIIPGNYILSVESHDYKSYRGSEPITITEDSKIENLQITLNSYVIFKNLQLSVFHSENEIQIPLDSCEIYLWNHFSREPMDGRDTIMTDRYYGFTDNEGKIIFPEIREGSYIYSVSKRGFQLPYFFTEPTIRVTQDNQTEFIQLIKMPEPVVGTIKGKVFQESSGNPVPALVEFFKTNRMVVDTLSDPDRVIEFPNYSVFTNDDGSYEAIIDTGAYKVKASYYAYSPLSRERYDYFLPYAVFEFYDNSLTISDAKSIYLTENEITEGINIGLDFIEPEHRMVVITGTVRDETGNMLSNANIDAHLNTEYSFYGDMSNSAVTDNLGNFTLELKVYSIKPFEIRISAWKEGYTNVFFNNKPIWHMADPILVAHNGSDTLITDINIQLEKLDLNTKFSLGGSITDSVNAGLPNIYVEANGLNNHHYGFTVTDSLGNFLIQDLIAGKYILSFFGDQYQYEFYNDTYIWEEAEIIDLHSNVVGINAVLNKYENDMFYILGERSSNSITGEILDADGNPLSGVFINVLNAEGKVEFSTTTNSGGQFRIVGLYGTEYTITVSKVEFESLSQIISLNQPVNQFNIILNKTTTETDEENPLPVKYELINNYPNPFNPSTKIKFVIPENGLVTLKVFNILGQEVATLLNKQLTAGSHELTFDASELSSGIYLYKLQTMNFVQVKKMMLLK